MEDKKQLVGAKLPAFELTVERGKIKEFVAAIGDDSPVYRDAEAARRQGYRDVIAPPTFGTVIDLWGGKDFYQICSLLQVNPVMVLHGEQEYQYFAPIHPGDHIVATTEVVDHREKKNMHLFFMVTEYVNQRGELVLKSRSTLVERKAVGS